jgi:hypothetical protein
MGRQDHERMHPHLLDMTHDRPVAGLVFGESSVAGEIWLPNAEPMRLDSMRVVGPHLRDLRPEPLEAEPAEGRFARQVLLFGDAGQAILRRMTVAIAGAGGGGSLIAESLAHLGVGRIIVIDFDRVSESNLSRVVGATPEDAARGRLKIEVLEDLVARIDPTVAVTPIYGDITYTDDALRLAEADFAFLATDTTFARYAFNAITHQYLIPGIQVGSKVSGDDATGAIELIHVMERPLTLAGACLDCSGAINRTQLRREQLTDAERQAQDYVQGAGAEAVEDPSVITLNAISTSLATTDFLLMVTGLLATDELEHRAYYPQTRELRRRPYDPNRTAAGAIRRSRQATSPRATSRSCRSGGEVGPFWSRRAIRRRTRPPRRHGSAEPSNGSSRGALARSTRSARAGVGAAEHRQQPARGASRAVARCALGPRGAKLVCGAPAARGRRGDVELVALEQLGPRAWRRAPRCRGPRGTRKSTAGLWLTRVTALTRSAHRSRATCRPGRREPAQSGVRAG